MSGSGPRSESGSGWAPLRAADLLAGASQNSAEHVPLTPLSQLPVPEASPLPRDTTSLPLLRALSADDSDDQSASEEWDDVVDDVYEEEIAPITRARLRMRSGVHALDRYAGQARLGGAFATHDARVPYTDAPALGFPIGSALEIVGPPGVGKTTWVLQIAMLERMAHLLHSLDLALDDVGSPSGAPELDSAAFLDENVTPWCAQVLLAGTSHADLDTEGSITTEWLVRLAQATVCEYMDAPGVLRFRRACLGEEEVHRASLERCLLQGIHLVRIASLSDLLAFLGVAASSVLKVPGLPPRTSLLILDSISFLLNTHTLAPNASREQRKTRQDAIQHVVQALTALRDFRIPEHDRLTVVVTNQMATRMPGERRPDTGLESVLVPSLTAAPSMRGSFDASAYDWGPSILGRSGWRILLFYQGAQGTRYVACLPRLLYIQAHPETSHDASDACIPFVVPPAALLRTVV